MRECEICCFELSDKKARKQVICPYCHFTCCHECFQKYLLGITQQYCMNCKVTFSDKFIQSVLPKRFIKDEFNTHMQDIFMMKEKERLRLYEHLVPKYKRRDKDILIIKNLISKIRKLNFKRKRNKLTPDEEESLNKLKEEVQLIADNGFRISINRADIDITKEIEETKAVKCTIKEKLEYPGPHCPINDCRGHTVSYGPNYKCNICESIICKKCLSVLDTDHKCDPSDIKSLELITQDSKRCPGCGVMIYRQSGCPAMFCVSCHVSFNWNSLIIEEPSHNPHYYEWIEIQRKKKKYTKYILYSDEELSSIDQTLLPDLDMLSNCIIYDNTRLSKLVKECHRLANELKDIIPMTMYDESDIELLRVRYLASEISTSKFLEKTMMDLKKNCGI
jgi:hypothetical protein